MKYLGITAVIVLILGVIIFFIKTKESTYPPTNNSNSRQEENNMENHKDSLKQELEQLIQKRTEKEKVLSLLRNVEEQQKKEKEQWEKANNVKKDQAEKDGDADKFHDLLMEQIALSDTLQSTQEEIGDVLHELSDLEARISNIESELE